MVRAAAGLCLAVIVALAVGTRAAAADPVADFYRGKSLRLVVGGSTGGGYDAVGRLLARHIGRHIPGNPTIYVENMSGAGSLLLMNYLHNRAPRDGTTLGMPTTNVLFDSKLQLPAAGGASAAFDINRVSWIGTPAQQPQVLFVWHTTPFNTLADLRANRMVVGAISAATDTYILPMFMKHLLHTDTTVIPGYKGSAEILAAMERREVDAHVALLANVTAGNSAYLKDNKIRLVLQFGRGRSAELPNVPTAAEWAEADADKRLFQFYGIKYEMSYPIMVVPGVPAERIEALRNAFDATMADPQYQEEATRIGVSVTPLRGVAMHELMKIIDGMPDDLVARLRTLITSPSGN
jgi:tripartite-type tricarboxylate transporter receptor subunit TctC